MDTKSTNPSPSYKRLYGHLLDMLGVKTHEEAGAEIGRLHASALPVTQPEGKGSDYDKAVEAPIALEYRLLGEGELIDKMDEQMDDDERWRWVSPHLYGTPLRMHYLPIRRLTALPVTPARSPHHPTPEELELFVSAHLVAFAATDAENDVNKYGHYQVDHPGAMRTAADRYEAACARIEGGKVVAKEGGEP